MNIKTWMQEHRTEHRSCTWLTANHLIANSIFLANPTQTRWTYGHSIEYPHPNHQNEVLVTKKYLVVKPTAARAPGMPVAATITTWLLDLC